MVYQKKKPEERLTPGRKKADDPVVAVQFYVKQSLVDKAGGMEQARLKAKELFEQSISQPSTKKKK